MAFITQNSIFEILTRTNGFSTDVTPLTTSLGGTATLTPTSTVIQYVTGTATGYSVQLTSALSVTAGFWTVVFNNSSQSINIKDGSGATLIVLHPQGAAECKLMVAGSVAGTWLITETESATSDAGDDEALIFNSTGGTGAGAYFDIGQTSSGVAGILVPDNDFINAMSVTNSTVQAVGKSSTFRLQRRTGAATFVDIPGTDITIASGTFSTYLTGLNVAIAANTEISAYRIAPDPGAGTATNCILCVFLGE